MNTNGISTPLNKLFDRYPDIPAEIRTRYLLTGVARVVTQNHVRFSDYAIELEDLIARHQGNWLIPLSQLPVPSICEQHMVISGLYSCVYAHYRRALRDHFLAFRTTLLYADAIVAFHKRFCEDATAAGARSRYYVTDSILYRVAEALINDGECSQYDAITVKNVHPPIIFS